MNRFKKSFSPHLKSVFCISDPFPSRKANPIIIKNSENEK